MCSPYFHFKQAENGQCIPTAQLNEWYRDSLFCLNEHCAEWTCRFLLWFNVPTLKLCLCFYLIRIWIVVMHCVHSPWHYSQFFLHSAEPTTLHSYHNPVDFIHSQNKTNSGSRLCQRKIVFMHATFASTYFVNAQCFHETNIYILHCIFKHISPIIKFYFRFLCKCSSWDTRTIHNECQFNRLLI